MFHSILFRKYLSVTAFHRIYPRHVHSIVLHIGRHTIKAMQKKKKGKKGFKMHKKMHSALGDFSIKFDPITTTCTSFLLYLFIYSFRLKPNIECIFVTLCNLSSDWQFMAKPNLFCINTNQPPGFPLLMNHYIFYCSFFFSKLVTVFFLPSCG